MTFRTVGNLVLASNQSRDLTNLVCAWLLLWRKHANGCYDVTVPMNDFSVIFDVPTEHHLQCILIHTHVQTHSVAQYYDVDSDYFQESWGADNISSYRSETTEHVRGIGINIPHYCLLMSAENMEADIKKRAAQWTAEQSEKMKQRQIADLEKRLADLKK